MVDELYGTVAILREELLADVGEVKKAVAGNLGEVVEGLRKELGEARQQLDTSHEAMAKCGDELAEAQSRISELQKECQLLFDDAGLLRLLLDFRTHVKSCGDADCAVNKLARQIVQAVHDYDRSIPIEVKGKLPKTFFISDDLQWDSAIRKFKPVVCETQEH